jgi:hypothetical protein
MRCAVLVLAALLVGSAAQAEPAAYFGLDIRRPDPQRDLLARLARDHPLPKPKPLSALLAALAVGPIVSKTVLQAEYGGKIEEHWARFIALADSGDEVEIRGTCQSACTLVTAQVPKARLCFADNANLAFHQARSIADNSVSPQVTYWMVTSYPPDIRAWIAAKGGPAKIPAVGYWVLNAPDLWEMGYKRCD